MGTPVQTIITDAYREMNVVALGLAPTANQNAEGLSRLNRIVRSVLGHQLGEKLLDWQAPQPQRTAEVAANFPQLPYPIGTDVGILPMPNGVAYDVCVAPYPPQNSRIVWGGVTMTVFFPEAPDNGARMMLVQGSGLGDGGTNGDALTLDGNGRFIGAPGTAQAAFTFNAATPFAPALWLYTAETGLWNAIADFALTDSLPFSEEHDDFWTAALAIRLAPRYNKAISAETKAAFSNGLIALQTAYRQSGTTIYGSQDFPRSLQSFTSGRWNWA